tara:strand:- start:3583 stop:3876 length:294 start_codon:yes stop_codon:yes gene_type:complete
MIYPMNIPLPSNDIISLHQFVASADAPLYSTDGTPEDEKEVLFRLGHPNGWVWTAYEAEVDSDGVITCFGRVDGFESELGYFTASEVLEAGGFLEIA